MPNNPLTIPHNSTLFTSFSKPAARTDFSVATKNKYLASAKIFLKELNRIGILPMDITQNVKAFSQDKKHKRDGLSEEEITLPNDKKCLLTHQTCV